MTYETHPEATMLIAYSEARRTQTPFVISLTTGQFIVVNPNGMQNNFCSREAVDNFLANLNNRTARNAG